MSSGILYYTCNTHPEEIEQACRAQLAAACAVPANVGMELGTVSRESIDFGDWNVVVDRPRSPETMHRQVLAGLERMDADTVFLCESDVLYHPSHFEFEPPKDDEFYYNTNVWKVRYEDGYAVWTDDLQQVSGLCAYRELLLAFYRARVAQIEREGFDRHYEPGPKTGSRWARTSNRQSACPNLDIRHGNTLTRSKWSPEEFRNARYAKGWRDLRPTGGELPGWGNVSQVMDRVRSGSYATV